MFLRLLFALLFTPVFLGGAMISEAAAHSRFSPAVSEVARVMNSPLGQAIMFLPEWDILSHDLLGENIGVVRSKKNLSKVTSALNQAGREAQAAALAERLGVLEKEFSGITTLSTSDRVRLERRVQEELQINFKSSPDCRNFLASGSVKRRFTPAEWNPTNPAQVPSGVDPAYAGSRRLLNFSFPGMQVASIEDATYSTGSTVFFFDKGAIAAYDSRGGSVAAIETTLFDQGSYSADIDAVVLNGGSTMGLAATDGVRQAIFRARAGKGSAFDFIPSAPGAVVYDYSGRVYPHHDSGIYPTTDFGAEAMERLSSSFVMGRAGAGLNTTANKWTEGAKRFWAGQGAAYSESELGKIFVAVILNSAGDVLVGGESISSLIHPVEVLLQSEQSTKKSGKNTTLSLIVVDTPLDRNALKRLSVMVHTNMASVISPFQTYGDGDINFAVTTNKKGGKFDEEFESKLQAETLRLMRIAIVEGALTANRVPDQVIKDTLKKLK